MTVVIKLRDIYIYYDLFSFDNNREIEVEIE